MRGERVSRALQTTRERGGEIRRSCARLDVPWARSGIARLTRETILKGALGPMMDVYVRIRTRGRDRLEGVQPPVVLVANHQSHLDTPVILRALPRRWRQRTAVAAAADYFYRNRLVAHAVSLVFNTVPIQRRGGGLGRNSTEHVDVLIEESWNLLMYPEGTRSRDGRLGKLRSGAAVIAQEHDLPIVPVHVVGTHAAMPPGRTWPKRKAARLLSRRHAVEVRFGEPIRPAPGEDRNAVMARVRAFLDAQAAASDGASPAVPTRFIAEAPSPRDATQSAARSGTGEDPARTPAPLG